MGAVIAMLNGAIPGTPVTTGTPFTIRMRGYPDHPHSVLMVWNIVPAWRPRCFPRTLDEQPGTSMGPWLSCWSPGQRLHLAGFCQSPAHRCWCRHAWNPFVMNVDGIHVQFTLELWSFHFFMNPQTPNFVIIHLPLIPWKFFYIFPVPKNPPPKTGVFCAIFPLKIHPSQAEVQSTEDFCPALIGASSVNRCEKMHPAWSWKISCLKTKNHLL